MGSDICINFQCALQQCSSHFEIIMVSRYQACIVHHRTDADEALEGLQQIYSIDCRLAYCNECTRKAGQDCGKHKYCIQGSLVSVASFAVSFLCWLKASVLSGLKKVMCPTIPKVGLLAYRRICLSVLHSPSSQTCSPSRTTCVLWGHLFH